MQNQIELENIWIFLHFFKAFPDSSIQYHQELLHSRRGLLVMLPLQGMEGSLIRISHPHLS